MALEEKDIERLMPGARVRVWERIQEKDKERQTPFEGIILARKHGTEKGATFTVRTTIQGIGVEKVYPIFSPIIARIEFLEVPKRLKRSKLYYMRTLSAHETREKLQKLYR